MRGQIPYFSEPPYPSDIYKWWPRDHDFVQPSGFVSGAGLRNDLGTCWDLTAGAAAGSQIAESIEFLGGNNGGPLANRADMLRHPGGAAGLWDRPFIAHVRVDERARDAGNATVGIGMEVGSPNLLPAAFPANPFAASAQFQFVQFFMDQAAVPQVWLRVNSVRGGGTQTLLVGATLPPTVLGAINQPKRLTIAYKPDEYVRAFVDGFLACEQITLGNLPLPTQPGGFGLGTFVYHQGAAVDVIARFLYSHILTGGIE